LRISSFERNRSDEMPETKVSRRFDEMCRASGKTNAEIAASAGFARPNVISMMRQGEMKLPIAKVYSLAAAVADDPLFLYRLALESYQPSMLEALEASQGPLLSQNEREVLRVIREVSNGKDPEMTDFQRRMVAELFKDRS
jgi:hypothetical protein